MKNIKGKIITLILILLTTALNAQVDRRQGVIVHDGYPGGITETINFDRSSVVEGSFFINDYWAVGDVILRDGKAIKSMPLKYNLRDELLLILDENEVSRAIRDDQIDKFAWFDPDKKKNVLFHNARDYKLNGTPLVGVFEIITEGPVDLLKFRTVTVQEGYYSVTHDAGQQNDEYMINDTHYLSRENALFEVKGKKDLYAYFGDLSDEIKKYVKKNALRPKQTDDLARIVNHYNSMVE